MTDIEGEPGPLMLGGIEVSNTTKQRLAEEVISMGEKEEFVRALEEQGYGLENILKLRETIELKARNHRSISEEREIAILRLTGAFIDMGGEVSELNRDPEDVHPKRGSFIDPGGKISRTNKKKYPETGSGARDE